MGLRGSVCHRSRFPHVPSLPCLVPCIPALPCVVSAVPSTSVLRFRQAPTTVCCCRRSFDYRFSLSSNPSTTVLGSRISLHKVPLLVSTETCTPATSFRRYPLLPCLLPANPSSTVPGVRKSRYFRFLVPANPASTFFGISKVSLLPLLVSAKHSTTVLGSRSFLHCRSWFLQVPLPPFFFASTDCCTTFFRFPHVRLPPCLVSAQMCM